MSYLDSNTDYWTRGYDAPNVEGFVFRAYPWYFRHHGFTINNETRILDFGCGQGSNVLYFTKFGAKAYGVDISAVDIQKAQEKSGMPANFQVIASQPKDEDIFFGGRFDLIMAIQSLYYYDNDDLKRRLNSLYSMLNPGGIVFFTMISPLNYYYRKALYFKNGLYEVAVDSQDLRERHNRKDSLVHFINFTHSTTELIDRFSLFKCLDTGYYDMNFRDSSGHHYMFLGRKEA
ncbi:MAG: class I SAM-dependent methyltransferase [Desulfovibrionaceae bacterium]|jgi:2-polyprenyl-3-methyl-5-hydroxy-6-metoxy-1,4-benzoquinol methylase|nr:class I SAM-dependent methyltransferase [Desulfovibrionaceae bacterium]